MKFTCAGDFLAQRRFPGEYEGFAPLRDYIMKGDFRFVNLETTLNEPGECYGSQFCGGSYLRAVPETVLDVKKYGFNILSAANNHTLDYSYGGLLATIDALKKYDMPHAGIGRNLSEAAAPAYLDTLNGRAALISVTASFHETAMAGEQNRLVKGRPGVNGLRNDTYYTVSKKEMEMIRELARVTQINGYTDVVRAEGYRPPLPEGAFDFGTIRFFEGEETRKVQKANKKDMKRVEKAIFDAKLQADCIIVSLHAHDMLGANKELPAEYVEEFARACIDFGAHAVIGHGPHLLRPLEIYKGKPIFYSLGNFLLNNENIPYAPEEMYDKEGLEGTATMHELFEKRSGGFKRGLYTAVKNYETIVPYFEIEEGELTKLEFMPVELGFGLPRSRYGMPRYDKNPAFIERFADLCALYGTKFDEKDGLYRVKL
ncbi:MAG: CapA family protein [Ruminococcaceae bacterium]|nr:CapA family protein [Oscillospiraceae bacterium]